MKKKAQKKVKKTITINWKITFGSFLFLLLLLFYVDKSFLHEDGLKSVERSFTKKVILTKPTVSPQKEAEKQNQDGYNFAEDQDITDSNKCPKPSQAFFEGCKAYVEDNADTSLQDQDSADQY